MKKEILRMEHVTYQEKDSVVLDKLNLHLFAGEIMGVVGINAFGQEALLRLLCVNEPIHYGRVYFDEVLVNHYAHSDRSENPVAVIEQRSRLLDSLSVVDNIFVLQRGFQKHVIRKKELYAQLAEFTKGLPVKIDGSQIVSRLSFYEKRVVELLKAVATGKKVVIIREISNFISVADRKEFYRLMRHFAERGISFLYFCNHHEEAFQICDRISMMENGRILKVFQKEEFLEKNILPFTIDFSRSQPAEGRARREEPLLEFQNVHTKTMRGLSFSMDQGECAVLLDVNNTVLKDIALLLLCREESLLGEIRFLGERLAPKRKGRQRVGVIWENPLETMLFWEMNALDNLCFLVEETRGGFRLGKRLKKSVAREYAAVLGKELLENDVSLLSRRSLYSLIYYRIHLFHPELVVCIQPFAGADMYLRHHILDLLNALRQKGITVLILAVSLSDTLFAADRLFVVQEGRLSKEIDSGHFCFFNEQEEHTERVSLLEFMNSL